MVNRWFAAPAATSWAFGAAELIVASTDQTVNCADEAAGELPDDPAVLRHLGRDWDNAVYVVTRRVLARARDEGIGTAQAAIALADELAREPHPIWPGRARAIGRSLT